MKILALLTDAYGAGGGIAQYNRDLMEAFVKADSAVEIEVLARNGRISFVAEGNRIKQLGVFPSKVAFLFRALLVVWRGPAPQLIFCGHIYMLPLAAILAWLTGAQLWLQLHGIEAWQRSGVLVNLAVARVQWVTAVSRYTRERFLSWANCSPSSVKVLPNTVADVFTPGPVPLELQQRYETAGKQVLLTVSRLAASERYKGHDRVMRAMATLTATHPQLCYLIAGEGDDQPRLQTLAQQLQLGDKVKFIGFVNDDELPALFRLVDVFVMPSTGEGFGIVFLQALVSGTPTIAADADGSRDPLRDGTAGTLVSLTADNSLATALAAALSGNTPDTTHAAVFKRENFARHVAMLLGAVNSVHKGAAPSERAA